MDGRLFPILSDEQAQGFSREAVLALQPDHAPRAENPWHSNSWISAPDIVVPSGAPVQPFIEHSIAAARRSGGARRIVVKLDPGPHPGCVFLPRVEVHGDPLKRAA